MNGKLRYLRFLAYALELIILYVLSGIPNFMPSLFGSKPVLLIAAALTIAVFEDELPSMIMGLSCGVLIDVGTDAKIGYYTLILTVLCFVLGYCQRNFFVTNFLNATVIGVCSLLGVFLLHFLIFGVFMRSPDLGQVFLKQYLIRFIYTALFLPILYWLNRLFYSLKKGY